MRISANGGGQSESGWRSKATKSAAADRPGRVFWSVARKYGKAKRPQGTLGAAPLIKKMARSASTEKSQKGSFWLFEVRSGIEPLYQVLQTCA